MFYNSHESFYRRTLTIVNNIYRHKNINTQNQSTNKIIIDINKNNEH